MKFETVIGLEVHVEMATKSKIFCSCSAKFGGEQNDHVCPACCGMPGMLPIVNRHVVDLGMAAGMMLNCHINRTTTFDKKSYYYPDLPSSYQTTQWFAPVAVNGTVEIETAAGKKNIRIKHNVDPFKMRMIFQFCLVTSKARIADADAAESAIGKSLP